jgi:hypothetical protein
VDAAFDGRPGGLHVLDHVPNVRFDGDVAGRRIDFDALVFEFGD